MHLIGQSENELRGWRAGAVQREKKTGNLEFQNVFRKVFRESYKWMISVWEGENDLHNTTFESRRLGPLIKSMLSKAPYAGGNHSFHCKSAP